MVGGRREVKDKNQLSEGDWRIFCFSTGNLLLHVPSSHIFRVDDRVVSELRSDSRSKKNANFIRSLKRRISPLLPDIKKDKVFTSIALNVAEGCNLTCPYCYARNLNIEETALMSKKTAWEAVDYFSRKRKKLKVVFFGGEPLLNFDVIKTTVEYCRKLKGKSFEFSLTTNGTNLTMSKLAFFRKHRFSITLSYDGDGLQEKQRKYRLNKERSTERDLAWVISYLEKYHKDFSRVRLRATVTKKNLDQLGKMLHRTLNSKKLPLAISTVISPDQRHNFARRDIRKYYRELTKFSEKLLKKKDYQTLLRIENITNRLRLLYHGFQAACCGAGEDYLAVSAGGGLFLCHRFIGNQLGQVGVVTQGPDKRKLRHLLQLRGRQSFYRMLCATCWVRNWCQGGCYYANLVNTRKITKPDPLFCLAQKLEFSLVMRIYGHLVKNDPELLRKEL